MTDEQVATQADVDDDTLDRSFPWKPWGCLASLLLVLFIYIVATAIAVWPWLWGMNGYADFLCGLDTPSNDTCLPEISHSEIRDFDARLIVRVGGTHYNWYGGGCWSEDVRTGPTSIEVRGYGPPSLERQGNTLLVNGHTLQPEESWQDSGPILWSPVNPWFIEREKIRVRNNGVFDCVATLDGRQVPVDMLYVTGELQLEGLRLTLLGLVLALIAILALIFSIAQIRKSQKTRES
jgi:hypothetical protein